MHVRVHYPFHAAAEEFGVYQGIRVPFFSCHWSLPMILLIGLSQQNSWLANGTMLVSNALIAAVAVILQGSYVRTGVCNHLLGLVSISINALMA